MEQIPQESISEAHRAKKLNRRCGMKAELAPHFEHETLLSPDQITDFDLEHNIKSLCQYLAASDAETDDERYPSGQQFFLGAELDVIDLKAGDPHEFGMNYPRRPLLSAQDFLNIPPPTHSPNASPDLLDQRPVPPQRTLPLPPASEQHRYGDEPQYEDPQLPPLLAAPRSTKMKSVSNRSLPQAFANVRAETDWQQYETSVLGITETGSYFIPSENTTMSSSISPSRKSELRENGHGRHYSLLPSAQTTVPVPVLPLRPELAAPTLNCRYSSVKPSPARRADKWSASIFSARCCSWRRLAYSLAVVLFFALSVISYLVVTLFTHPPTSLDGIFPARPAFVEGNPTDTWSPRPGRPMPEVFPLGDNLVADLLPGFVYSSFNVQRDHVVQFNLSVDPQTKLVIYGRQTLQPSPAEFDFIQIVLGPKLHASPKKRSTSEQNSYFPEKHFRSTTFTQFLSAGLWRLAIFNDASELRTLRFSATLAANEKALACGYNCYGKGDCVAGKCSCFQGYVGAYCEETVCPILCSGNGIFTGGRCHCHQGWKGDECDLPSNVCEIPDCSGHGRCNSRGSCDCDVGFMGPGCAQPACLDLSCSGRGVCVNATCLCPFGWRGEACEEAYTAGTCSANLVDVACSGNGRFDASAKRCHCDSGWTGKLCDIVLCALDCGDHGVCMDETQCKCNIGWTGERCEQRSCGNGCEEHGLCLNGTCVCHKGWSGRNCQLGGCPANCSEHGECRKSGDVWRCACVRGYVGHDCSVPLELACNDGRDNDKDGLTDCEDSECCTNPRCEQDPLCQTVPSPMEILLRKQPPSPQATFFEKVNFLLDSDSVQQYADLKLFNASRVSVLRGRVVSHRGGALVGVRVTDASNALYGFTISRHGGEFDLLVNGGGSVTLQFMRLPFGSTYKSVSVPWNQILHVGDVVMTFVDSGVKVTPRPPDRACQSAHDKHSIRPHALPAWKLTKFGGPTDANGVLVDSQVVQQTMRIPDSDIRLVYRSSDAAGFASHLLLSLVPDSVPERLRTVAVSISIEGLRHETILEAQTNLTYMFAWDKRNVYKQKVYGLASVKIEVAYQYAGCTDVFTEVITSQMKAFSVPISHLGGWNIDIHHYFDVAGGVLERGDGSAFYVADAPLLLRTLFGSKQQRPLDCGLCTGPAERYSLFMPSALAAGVDGSIFVGDFNLIRRWGANSTLTTVLELSTSDTAHPYYLATHPISGHLYISLPLRRQVWRLRESYGFVANPKDNYVVVAGTGQMCVMDEDCGDSGFAEMAKLNYPKGLAFNSQGVMYVADSRRVRMVTAEGLISSLGAPAGDVNTGLEKCVAEFESNELQFHWPTALAVNTHTDRLYVLDSDIVYEFYSAERVRIVAGSPSHCAKLVTTFNVTVRPPLLKAVSALAVDLKGRLLVAETDRKRTHQVRVIVIDAEARTLAGRESKCDCEPKNCPCDDAGIVLATEGHLHNPVGLTVTPDGQVHVADQGNHKIRTIFHALQEVDSDSGAVQVFAADRQELYTFNRFGHHTHTRSLHSGRYLFNFTYHVDTGFGKLVQIAGANGHKVYVSRRFLSEIHVENTNGLKSVLALNYFGLLERYVAPNGLVTRFDYSANSGLLTSRLDSDNTASFYRYDGAGLVQRVFTPIGEVLDVHRRLYGKKLLIEVRRGDAIVGAFAVQGIEVDYSAEVQRAVLSRDSDNFVLLRGDGSSVQYDGRSYSLLAPYLATLHRRKVVVPASEQVVRPELSQKTEWRFYVRPEGGQGVSRRVLQVGKKARVNGVNVLTLEYDRTRQVESIFDQNSAKILSVQYNSAGAPALITSESQYVAPVNFSWDAVGRLLGCAVAEQRVRFDYDRRGRLIQLTAESEQSGLARKYTYATDEQALPSAMELSSVARFVVEYGPTDFIYRVTIPSGLTYTFTELMVLGARHRFVYPPGSTSPFVFSTRENGEQPIALRWPHGHRRASMRYCRMLLCELFHDRQLTSLVYIPQTNLLKVETVRGDGFMLQRSFAYQGSLVAECYDRRTLDSSIEAHYGYFYDSNMRLQSVQVAIDDASLQPLNFGFDANTGALTAMSGFRFFAATPNKLHVSNERFARETTWNPNGRLVRELYSVQGRTVAEITLTDHPLTLRTAEYRVLAGQERITCRYQYGPEDGSLRNVICDEPTPTHEWSYNYTQDGYLSAVNDRSLNYHANSGLLQAFGFLSYVADDGGCIVQRGSDILDFDALGRLTAVRHKSEVKARYFFDAQGRAVAQVSADKKTRHFFYANPDQPALLTHVFFENKVTVLYYDRDQRLFALERDGEFFLVVTRPDRTPTHVIKADGQLAKNRFFSPYGEILRDSAPDFYLPVGFRGQFHDADVGLVLFANGRAYDPLVGQYLSPDWLSVLRMNPYYLDRSLPLHRFALHDPVHVPFEMPWSLTDWLNRAGFHMGVIAAHSTPQPEALCDSNDADFPLYVGAECPFRRRTERFDQLLSESNSRLLPPLRPDEAGRTGIPARFKPAHWVLGDDVAFANDSNWPVLNVLDNTDRAQQDLLRALVNQSVLLPYTFVVDDKVVHYIIKPNVRHSEEVLKIGAADGDGLQGKVNFTLEAFKNYAVARLWTAHAALHVFYGIAVAEARQTILLEAEQRAIRDYWSGERARNTQSWTSAEKDELQRDGRVSGFELRQLKPSLDFPWLADDPSNLQLVKTTQ